jgi:hypothetical protein
MLVATLSFGTGYNILATKVVILATTVVAAVLALGGPNAKSLEQGVALLSAAILSRETDIRVSEKTVNLIMSGRISPIRRLCEMEVLPKCAE